MSPASKTTPITEAQKTVGTTRTLRKSTAPEADPESRVKDSKTAWEMLTKEGYVTTSMELGPETVSTLLFQLTNISSGMPKITIDGVRAIAYILREEGWGAMGRKLKEQVQEACGEIREKVAEAVKAAVQGIADVQEAATQPGTGTPGTHQATYASVTGRNVTPVTHTPAVDRGRAKESQVFVDVIEGMDKSLLIKMEEAILIKKAEMAAETMAKGGTDVPESLKFQGVTKLRNGGIIYHLDGPESATWLRSRVKEFAQAYHPGIEVKPTTFPILVRFVPLSFEPTSKEELRVMEGRSNLKEGVIESARWMKPVARRSPGQASAHLIVNLTSQVEANRALKDGMVIGYRKVYAQRLTSEPRRCLKCQRFEGHIAENCPQEHETCAKCAGKHATRKCDAEEGAVGKCSNCNVEGHGAGNRECPIFIRRCENHDQAHPENNYRYFPTSDPWTWETVKQYSMPEQYQASQNFRPAWQKHLSDVQRRGPPLPSQRRMFRIQQTRSQTGPVPPVQPSQAGTQSLRQINLLEQWKPQQTGTITPGASGTSGTQMTENTATPTSTQSNA